MVNILRINLLGEVTIQKDGQPITGLPSRAAEALLIYLACNPKPIAREKLAELLWADRASVQALTNLRTILTPLRRELGDYLTVTRDALAFNGERGFSLDASEFENQLQDLGFPDRAAPPTDPAAIQALRLILDLYRGDFLEGFYLRDGLGFEEWSILQRERLKRLARAGFRALTHACLESGLYTEGLLAASRWERLDPFDEEACRAQMWLFLRTGQRAAALQRYQTLKKKLTEELGVAPASATTDLFRRFQQVEVPPVVNLPAYSTTFLGRDAEIAELEARLSASGTRLVTITGAGGIGKTRLAVEAARLHYEKRPGGFLQGIHFIPLETVETTESLVLRIAEGIGFSFHGSETPAKQLLDHLRERECLLVLDNFEQLLDETRGGLSLLVDILRQAAGVKLLVTSRERLNLYEETVFDLHGLSVPEADASQPESFSAVTLFLQSARRVKRDFAPSQTEMADVTRICRLVDGAPLAIELASAWARHLSCGQIASQIESDLDFLASPYQDMPAGHRSLRAVFERSWNLLPSDEQNALAQLSVFRGGFTPEAAASVIGDASASTVHDLTDKSLVQRLAGERFDIHPLLHQYVAEKLAAHEDRVELAAASHAAYYLDFLAGLKSGETPEGRALIRPEMDNLRASWKRAIETSRFDALERTVGNLHSFFSVQSWFQEGIDLFEATAQAIAEKSGGRETGLLCELLGRQARMRIQVGQLEKTRAVLEQAMKYLEHMDDPARRSRVLDSLAITNYYAGDYLQATALAQESLSISEKTNNPDGMAFSLNFLGSCAKAQGNFDQSRKWFEGAVAVYRESQDEIGAAMTLNNLGNLVQLQNDFDAAQKYYLESSEIFKAQDHVHGAATTLANAGKLALKQGQYDIARNLMNESLEMKRRINDRRGEAVALAGLGDVSLATDSLADASTHLSHALELASQVGDAQLMLDLLAAVAALKVKQKKNDAALQLLSYILAHGGAAEEAKQKANQLLEELGNLSVGESDWGQEGIEEVVAAVINEM